MKKVISIIHPAFFFLLVFALTGCRSAAAAVPTLQGTDQPATQPPSLSEEALKNAAYSAPAFQEFFPPADRGQAIQLNDGKFRYVYQSGAATELVVQYVQSAPGDLDGDGDLDAAVLLQVRPGGSGSFAFLAAVLNDAGQARPVSAVLLGDRVKIEKMAVENGSILIDMLAQGPADPLCCPSVKEGRRYRLQPDGLVLLAAGS